MKKSFYIIFGALIVLSLGLYKINQQELRLGDGQAPADVLFSADVGTANDPALKYDLTSGAWQFSNNGTDFAAMGSGGGFGTNHVQNPDFELNATDWATFADGAVSEPVDGTGGSATATFARTTTAGEVRRGAGSGKFSKDAADRQGEGFSAELTLDDQDLQHLLGISFEYKTTANYVDGDMGVWIICDTGGSPYLIAPQEGTGLPATGGGRGKHIVSFLAPTSDTEKDCRLSMMVTNTAALAYDVIVDDVIVGPGVGKTTPVKDGGTSYSMAVRATGTDPSFGATDINEAIYYRDGDEMIIKYTFAKTTTVGYTEGTGDYLFSLPSGYTFNTNKIVANDNRVLASVVGEARFETSGALAAGVGVVYAASDGGANNSFIVAINDGALANANIGNNSGTGYVSVTNFYLSFQARVPIAEWANEGVTHLLDSDIPAQNARAVAYSTSGASYTDGSAIVYNIEEIDNSASYNPSTGEFTCPADGQYRVTAGWKPNVAMTTTYAIEVWLGGSIQFGDQEQGAGGNSTSVSVSGIMDCTKGDVITGRIRHGEGGSIAISTTQRFNMFHIDRISDITAGTPIGFGIAENDRYGLTRHSTSTCDENADTCSGTYTCTTSNDVNMNSATSCSLGQFMKVGNVVTYSTRVSLDITDGSILAGTDISLPITGASFTGAGQVSGTCGAVLPTGISSYTWYIQAQAPSSARILTGRSDWTGARDIACVMTYVLP